MKAPNLSSEILIDHNDSKKIFFYFSRVKYVDRNLRSLIRVPEIVLNNGHVMHWRFFFFQIRFQEFDFKNSNLIYNSTSSGSYFGQFLIKFYFLKQRFSKLAGVV